MTGKYEQGAWFNGKLYAMRCDVSFDGDWLVYMAMGAGGNTWNAVSRLPRLTAVAESESIGTYFGGGYWRARDVLCLNRLGAGQTGEASRFVPNSLARSTAAKI